jgi:carbamoyl-phosphate synthase large subunit
MPKRTDIKSILIIGAGPIVIGQACEFDYSGTQACKVLREEGYRIILVNSNPATIMTDPQLADATYIEPITPEIVEKIIEKERPDALLPTMGGQTALNLAKEAEELGIWEKYNVRLIGVDIKAIDKAEDREKFRQWMIQLGVPVATAKTANSFLEGKEFAQEIGFPLVIRPSFTLGGTGGGFVHDKDDLDEARAKAWAIYGAAIIGKKSFDEVVA